MRYTALDFETANSSFESACSIGLVKMDEEGEKVASYYSLIRPLRLEFDPKCMSINRLDPFEIASAPTISELYEEIEGFIGSDIIVSHNAKFDMQVLKASLASWGKELFDGEYYCTLSLSRLIFKNLPSHRLEAIAELFGWEYDAHNALEDAIIAGRLFSKLCGSALFDRTSFDRFIKRVYRASPSPYPKYLRDLVL